MRGKTLRVCFAKWWPNFDLEHNFLVDELRSHYEVEVVADGDIDIVFFSVFSGFLPDCSAVFVFYTGEARVPDMAIADWAFSYQYDEDFQHPTHLRLPLYVLDVDGCSFRHDWGQELVKNSDYADSVIAQKREQFCAYVVYYGGWARCEMFDRLSHYKDITAPGKNRNNAPPISNSDPEKSRLNANFQTLKQNYYQAFKFALVFENKSYSGYTSEKLVDAMLAGCIPIYWGNPDVVRDFNPQSFINVNDFETQELQQIPRWIKYIRPLYHYIWENRVMPRAFDKAVQRIREIDQDQEAYRAILETPWMHENRINKYFDYQRFQSRLSDIAASATLKNSCPKCKQPEL